MKSGVRGLAVASVRGRVNTACFFVALSPLKLLGAEEGLRHATFASTPGFGKRHPWQIHLVSRAARRLAEFMTTHSMNKPVTKGCSIQFASDYGTFPLGRYRPHGSSGYCKLSNCRSRKVMTKRMNRANCHSGPPSLYLSLSHVIKTGLLPVHACHAAIVPLRLVYDTQTGHMDHRSPAMAAGIPYCGTGRAWTPRGWLPAPLRSGGGSSARGCSSTRSDSPGVAGSVC